jgi:hypothetical protein
VALDLAAFRNPFVEKAISRAASKKIGAFVEADENTNRLDICISKGGSFLEPFLNAIVD